MKNKLWKYCILAFLYFAIISILPAILMPNTSDIGLFVLILIVLNPLFSLLSGAYYGFNHGFEVMIPVICAVAFLPWVFIIYNSSALPYCVFYALFGGTGCFIAGTVKKIQERKSKTKRRK